ncbi:MAG: orotidine-5'-phosphate decarboxylase [Candidatus Krumholzibacteriota bacterium]|nr:orotidine-5'-phosphate decarboxylase [Candidatus Krumholzibacteriota bacterium]
MSDTGNAGAAERLFVALDLPAAAEARDLAARLAPLGVGLKVGLELFTAEGPALVRELAAAAPLFLDLKYHDIPETVARAVRAAARLGAAVANLHVAGGEAMVRRAVAARDEAAAAGGGAPALIGVTVLTSLEGDDLRGVWGTDLAGGASEHARRLAGLARAWGLDGVVASAREAAAIRSDCGPGFLIVTPGIRPAGAAPGDQKRVLTPAAALRAGASHLVVGRPVTRAADPLSACRDMLAEMAAGA